MQTNSMSNFVFIKNVLFDPGRLLTEIFVANSFIYDLNRSGQDAIAGYLPHTIKKSNRATFLQSKTFGSKHFSLIHGVFQPC